MGQCKSHGRTHNENEKKHQRWKPGPGFRRQAEEKEVGKETQGTDREIGGETKRMKSQSLEEDSFKKAVIWKGNNQYGGQVWVLI